MRAKARLALLAVTIASAIAAVAPSSASAFVGFYNCTLKPSGQWCDGRANGTYDGLHSWDYNEGWYPGTWNNLVTACQRLWRPSTGVVLLGWSCSLNSTATYYGAQTCVCFEANVLQYSGGPHSINGEADADF
jgi:hypothetical protein